MYGFFTICHTGTGYATMTIVFLLDIYYCVIVAWTFFYLASCFTSFPTLPWENCSKITEKTFYKSCFSGRLNVSTFSRIISDNWWNTENCLKPDGVNSTHKFVDSEMSKRMFNTSLTFDENLESWSRMYFNESYALEKIFSKNNSHLTSLCRTLKSLSLLDSSKNHTGIDQNGSSLLTSGRNDEFLNGLRNCFNATSVTPAEEYWECVKSIVVFYFAKFLLVGMLL